MLNYIDQIVVQLRHRFSEIPMCELFARLQEMLFKSNGEKKPEGQPGQDPPSDGGNGGNPEGPPVD